MIHPKLLTLKPEGRTSIYYMGGWSLGLRFYRAWSLRLRVGSEGFKSSRGEGSGPGI